MLSANRIRTNNALTLQWHAGVSTVGLEPFRMWCLGLLKPRLRFDGAIWAIVPKPGVVTAAGKVQSPHLHRLPPSAAADFERLRGSDLDDKPSGMVLNRCYGDADWEAPAHAEVRDHALRNGMANSLLLRHAMTDGPGEQFILLTRKAVAHRFSASDVAQFEWLGPHMVQAYANRRRLFVESLRAGDRRSSGFAAAMVDRAGWVHEGQANFVEMLRREWSDWPGMRLPEPLMEVAMRRAGDRWHFVGTQVTADFEPVDDLILIAARPRHLADALTSRESEVAQRYAIGESFREIAQGLELAPATVRSHLRNVFGKLQVRNKTQLAAAMHR